MATTDSIVSKLPANVEAERSILGAILLDNMAYNEAAENLRPDDFSLDSHRRIYSRMMDLMESSRPIDIITLVDDHHFRRCGVAHSQTSERLPQEIWSANSRNHH